MFSHRSQALRRPATPPQQRHHVWRAWVLAVLVSIALGWQPTALVYAVEPGDQAIYRDICHTMLARKALLQDPILGPLNVGVRVQDRVATLWGPVPSREVMQRAVEVLRKLPDLLDVRNQLHVEEQENLRPQYLPEQAPGQVPAVPAPPPQLPGFSREDGARAVLTKRLTNNGAFLTPAQNVRPRPVLPPGFPTANDDGAGEAVLPMIAVPQARPAAPSWSSLQLAVNSLRFSDTRFQELRAEAQGGQVLLSGSAARWDDVRDFAAGLNRLPGVERVILGQVRTER